MIQVSKELPTTCGIFIFDINNNILIVHPTSASLNPGNWSIPKGLAEPGEKHIDAAVREVCEETSLIIDKKRLIELPEIIYKSGKKKLKPFATRLKEVGEIVCNSFVIIEGQEPFPENDTYQWVDLKKAKELLHESSSRCIDILIEKINEI